MNNSKVWIIGGIVLLVLAYVVMTYNALIAMIEAVRNNQKQIDIQLDRRFKVFESLINVVRKYMDYEQTTLKDVVALRNQALQAKAQGDEKTRMAAEDKISQIATNLQPILQLVVEQYPDLKASGNVQQLQEEIVNTENKLAFAKQAYNASIEQYNARKKSFFASIVTFLFRRSLDKNFEYWSLSPETIATQENYTIKL
jgi:LemA protein